MRSSFWDDTPSLSPDQVDVYVYDGGECARVHAPRQNNERTRVQYHDRRSRKERDSDARTAKQIAKTHPNERN